MAWMLSASGQDPYAEGMITVRATRIGKGNSGFGEGHGVMLTFDANTLNGTIEMAERSCF